MSLSELMSSYGLAFFPQVGLIVFIVVFVLVVARAALAPRSEMDRAARLALEDGAEEPAAPERAAREERGS